MIYVNTEKKLIEYYRELKRDFEFHYNELGDETSKYYKYTTEARLDTFVRYSKLIGFDYKVLDETKSIGWPHEEEEAPQ